MTIIGRLTKDAIVNHLSDERKVVNFSIAMNDYYKPKGHEKGIQVATFFNCSYWISATIAEKLKKGSIVELFGRIGVNVYKDMQGEAKGSLTFHVNNIKIHQFMKEIPETLAAKPARKIKKIEAEPNDDLPF